MKLPFGKHALPGLALSAWFVCHVLAVRAADPPPPPATNEYHGVTVIDPFRWLENGTNPAVREWSQGQNRIARGYLDGLVVRPMIHDRLTRLLSETAADYSTMICRRGMIFVLKLQPPAQQPVLCMFNSFTNLTSEHVVLDPNRLNPAGTTAIDWYVPSSDGKLVAVSLSENGSELGTLYVYETATGQRRPDIIPRVQAPTAAGSAAWNADSTGFFYTRYPSPSDRPPPDLDFYQQVCFHRLGTTPDQDTYEIGKEFPRIAEIELKSSPDGRQLLASVANGDGGEYAHYLRDPAGQWHPIARFEDQVRQVEFGRDPLYIEWGNDPALYLLSRAGAPKGKLLRLPLASLELAKAETILAESSEPIEDFKPAASGIGVVLSKGGPTEFAFLDFFGNALHRAQTSSPAAIHELVVAQGDEILYRTESYTEPYSWLHYTANEPKGRLSYTALAGKSPLSFSDVEVVREKVKSKDGTTVPLNIIRKRGTRLNRENPVILTGYGGFGLSQVPSFDVSRRVWLDQGGVLAVANLRGGSEFGESWHQAGSLTNKQNVFDDFAACAEFLMNAGYTTPAKLAIRGGSNGGLLMGATLTQHPDLMRAVVAQVGLYDMLRAELDPNGTFNVTEYGTVRHPQQFQALYAYSPYHHVRAGENYPAVLMLTGENDGRVNPAHSRKMVARLQVATTSQRPILLRTSSSGHGIGTALGERIEQLADIYAFLFDQLGLSYSLVDRGPWTGAVTPSSALVKAKLVQEGLTARLVLSQSPSLTDPIAFGPVAAQAGHGNIVAFPLANLEPSHHYYYALEIGGRLDRKRDGEFETFPPPGPASFSIAYASCARTGSPNEVFDRIRENHPLFFMNIGDFHYLDITTNSRPRFRAAYDAVLASPQQSELYRHIPFAYIWDDHDFAGNNSNHKALSRPAARAIYDEYVPHYPLPLESANLDGPICQSFSVGRVKFILTDLRSERDDVRKKDTDEKSMMGLRQKAWFKKELLEANGRYPLICWVSTVPWIGHAGTNVYHAVKTNQFGVIQLAQLPADSLTQTNHNNPPPNEDYWSVFSSERREIADFIKTNQIHGLCILHGDSHMLAADDGRNSDYATGGGAPIPVMCAAPLDQESSLKGGPYSQGVYRVREGEGCFGLLSISDKGDHIDVRYSGRNNKNEEKISLQFTVPASNPASKP